VSDSSTVTILNMSSFTQVNVNSSVGYVTMDVKSHKVYIHNITHELIHTGERQYICQKRGTRFRYSPYLYNHEVDLIYKNERIFLWQNLKCNNGNRQKMFARRAGGGQGIDECIVLHN